MSKETFYFRHDYNARTDRKLINIAMKYGMQGIGIFWCVVEMLYEETGYLPLEYERISFELRTDKNIVQSIINEFDLFKNDGVKFWSETVLERLQERCDKSEKARESINKRWDKYKNTNVIRTYEDRNTIKESKGKNKYTDEFELFYKAYPKRSEKIYTFKCWKKLNGERPSLEIILEAIRKQINWREKANGAFRPEWKNPATWLNKGCWADEVETPQGDSWI